MINIFLYRLINRMRPAVFEKYMQALPGALQKKIRLYRHWQDAERSLAGYTLLLKGLELMGQSGYQLNDLQYNEFNKPFFTKGIHFNIAHSGQYVLCTISVTHEVGVDVEEIKPIPLIDFTELFAAAEWQQVLDAADQLNAFYTLWTKKEAFLKVIGEGLNVPLNQVTIEDDIIQWKHKNWFLQPVKIDTTHVAHICTSEDDVPFNIKAISL